MQICYHDFVIEDTFIHTCNTFQQPLKQNKGEVEIPLRVIWTLTFMKKIIADCIRFTPTILDKFKMCEIQ